MRHGDLKARQLPGYHLLRVSKYASKESSTLVESGLEEGSVSIENNAVVITDGKQTPLAQDYVRHR